MLGYGKEEFFVEFEFGIELEDGERRCRGRRSIQTSYATCCSN